jgi:hypothetical protein
VLLFSDRFIAQTGTEYADNVFVQMEKDVNLHPQDTPRSFDFGDRKTFLVEPPTERMSLKGR